MENQIEKSQHGLIPILSSWNQRRFTLQPDVWYLATGLWHNETDGVTDENKPVARGILTGLKLEDWDKTSYEKSEFISS